MSPLRVPTMKTAPLTAALNEALVVHEVFRRLGFPAADIFLGVDPNTIYIEIRSQAKTFIVICGYGSFESKEVRAGWLKAGHAWNETMTTAEKDAIYVPSSIVSRSVELVAALIAKGFKLNPDRPIPAMLESTKLPLATA